MRQLLRHFVDLALNLGILCKLVHDADSSQLCPQVAHLTSQVGFHLGFLRNDLQHHSNDQRNEGREHAAECHEPKKEVAFLSSHLVA
uniref:Putative secreted protein n=1 Tax=Ixodes ricinus TaxID=34613 RepID=A0A6B0U1J4_IXORI